LSVYGVQGQAHYDNIFKVVFARKTPESLAALSRLISAITGRPLTVKSVIANEPAIDNLRDRQIRFDIPCKTENGELVDVEMSLNPDAFEMVRLEFYGAKLFTLQTAMANLPSSPFIVVFAVRSSAKTYKYNRLLDIRGTDYNELKATYQIAILAKGRFFDDDSLVHSFEYYEATLTQLAAP
jgi:hypothetical protein